METWRWTVETGDVESGGPTAAIGRWRDRSGLAVERSIRVDGARLRVESVVTNPMSNPVPFLWVEHLILDAALLGPGARLDLSGRVVALGDSRGPTDGWDAFEPWPTVRNHGALEDWGRLPPAGSARLAALRELRPPVGISGIDGTSVRLSWSVDVLPFMWLWIENGAATLPDGLTINCVGLEPANTASGEGLAASLERGEGERPGTGRTVDVVGGAGGRDQVRRLTLARAHRRGRRCTPSPARSGRQPSAPTRRSGRPSSPRRARTCG